MRIPKICRICLVIDTKLFKYNRYELKNYYEEIMCSKVSDKDDLPHYFCYECATLLHKYHKFKEKCFNGQKILKKLMCEGPITLMKIRKIDRHAEKLQSTISIITVNHRVRSLMIKSKHNPELCKTTSPVKLDIATDFVSSDDDFKDDYDVKEEQPMSLELVEPFSINVEEDTEQICCENIKPENEVVNVDEKISTEENSLCVERLSTDNERLQSDDGNTYLNNDDRPPDADEDLKEQQHNDNERLKTGDDSTFLDNYDIPADVNEDLRKEYDVEIKCLKKKKNLKGNKKKKKKKAGDTDKNKKMKRFEVDSKKNTLLDPNNWKKINLNEDEAIEEFKARALQKKFISAEYKCNDCLKGFSKEDMLNRHIKLRHSESVGPIECRFCHMRFKWKCYLRKHMRLHYTKYKCLRCDLVCPLETTALFHDEYHNGVTRKCAHCDEEFKHLTTYYSHLRTHRSKYVCSLCGASFVSNIGLRIHKKIKHIIEGESTTTENTGFEEYCKRCDIKFETKTAYEEHLVQSAMHVDGIEDLEVETPAGPIPRKRRQNRVRRFRKIPTDCHICGKNFATQSACRKHHLAEHPRTSFFAPNERQICEICGVSLAPGSVSSHLNTHTKEKTYSCNTCGKQFNTKSILSTHQLTHSNVKPVPCTLCDKRFKQVSSMRLHYRTFHLKEPYPKRNRKKKTDELSKLDDYPQEESYENLTIHRWRQ